MTPHTFEPLPQVEYPKGRNHEWALMLRQLPSELEEKLGLKFHEDVDELGYFQGAAALINGNWVFFMHHPEAPSPQGTVLYTAWDKPCSEWLSKDFVDELLCSLGYTADDLISARCHEYNKTFGEA